MSTQLKDPNNTGAKYATATHFLANVGKFEGPGKITLSADTGLVIGCRIGENVSPEHPYMFVEKQKLIDDIRMQGKSSQFIQYRIDIRKYPEKTLLLICLKFVPDEKDNFYLCFNVALKNEFQRLVKQDNDKILAYVKSCINRIARPWTSLGSEVEINENQPHNNRSLFIVELQSIFPFFEKRPHFDYDQAYMEMLPGRFSPNSVMRRLVDQSTQCIGLKISQKLQVSLTRVVNRSTQYSFKFPKITLSQEIEKIVKSIKKIYKEISGELNANFEICYFIDDYQELIKNPQPAQMLRPKEIASFQDIINCKNRKISSITWNPLISGIVAAAYVFQPAFCIVSTNLATAKKTHDHDEDSEKFYVLVWSLQDPLKPLLYLHATREVTFLTFCPYNGNILVGGCNNGQIIAWDMTNKFYTTQRSSFCNKVAYQYQVIIEKLTTWIRKIPGDHHVFPSIISDFNSGHCTEISTITWLPSSYYITRYGKYKTCMKEDPHMQILSASLSGSRILVYDLLADEVNTRAKKVRNTRLARLPAGLRPMQQTLAKMIYNFHPRYEMRIVKRSCHPIMDIIYENDSFSYKCENPETLPHRDQTSYFKVTGLLHPFKKIMKIMCSTGAGTLLSASWDGHNYDQGLKINSEKCRVKIFKIIHDGPVVLCQTNPFFSEIVLTVGGSILAIWDISKSESPLFWRKSERRYCSGMWSYIHPLAFVMIRDDVHYEYWDLSILSTFPVTCFKHKGTMILKLHSDSKKLHVAKKTFISTDEVGAFKIWTLPSWPNQEMFNREEALDLLNRMFQVKEYINELRRSCIRKIKKVVIVEEEIEVTDRVPSSTLSIGKSQETLNTESYVERRKRLFERRQEQYMRKQLLNKHDIQLKDINQHVQEKRFIQHLQQSKLQKLRSTAGEPVTKIKKAITATGLRVRRKIRVKIPSKTRKRLKKKYREEYQEIEKTVLRQMQPYTFEFNWNRFVQKKQAHASSQTDIPVIKYSEIVLDEIQSEESVTLGVLRNK